MNVFVEDLKKRLAKGLLVGCALIIFILAASLLSGQSVFNAFPLYLIPAMLLLAVLYGTGWYFAFPLIKRALRKCLCVEKDASLWQILTDSDLEYNTWAKELRTTKKAVACNEILYKAEPRTHYENELNLQRIENGEMGRIKTTVRKDGKDVICETVFY